MKNKALLLPLVFLFGGHTLYAALRALYAYFGTDIVLCYTIWFDVIDVLVRTSRKIPLLVELGMQTAHDAILSRIGRGYGHAAFCAGYSRLRRAGGDISIGLHILNGLPGEDRAMMLATAKKPARNLPNLPRKAWVM